MSVSAPHRLRLRPGLVPVRRDEHHLQLGLEPPAMVVLPDDREVRRLLADLVRGTTSPPRSRSAGLALARLDEAGLLVEPPTPPTPPATGVRLEGPPGLVEEIRPLIGPAAEAPADAPDTVTVLLERGPLPRDRVDPLIRAGTPHLVVTSGIDSWAVGPFVVPGHTACLRCVDAHLGVADPRRALVLEQLTRSRTFPDPDPLLQSLALPWAARDVLAFLAGETPTSWSTSCVFRRTGAVEEHRWERHPYCGCAWDLIAAG